MKARTVLVLVLSVVGFLLAARADSVRLGNSMNRTQYFEASLDGSSAWIIAGYLLPGEVRRFDVPDVSADLVCYVYDEETGYDGEAYLLSYTAGMDETGEVIVTGPGSMVAMMNGPEIVPERVLTTDEQMELFFAGAAFIAPLLVVMLVIRYAKKGATVTTD